MSLLNSQPVRTISTRAVKARAIPRSRKRLTRRQSGLPLKQLGANFAIESYAYYRTFKPYIVHFPDNQMHLTDDNTLVYKQYTEAERLNTTEVRLQSMKVGDPLFMSDNNIKTYTDFKDEDARLSECHYLGIVHDWVCMDSRVYDRKVVFQTCMYGMCRVNKVFCDRRDNTVLIKDTRIIIGLYIGETATQYNVFLNHT